MFLFLFFVQVCMMGSMDQVSGCLLLLCAAASSPLCGGVPLPRRRACQRVLSVFHQATHVLYTHHFQEIEKRAHDKHWFPLARPRRGREPSRAAATSWRSQCKRGTYTSCSMRNRANQTTQQSFLILCLFMHLIFQC